MKRTLSFLRAPLALLASAALTQAGTYPKDGTQGFDAPDGTSDLADGSVVASDKNDASDGKPVASVIGGALRLASKQTPDALGSFKLPVLDQDGVLASLDLALSVVMDQPVGGTPGEGWSVNFGAIPKDSGGGEGGFADLPFGLTIAFDTKGNGGDDVPSIEVISNRVSIANYPQSFVYGTSGTGLVLHWDSAGLDITWNSKKIAIDLPTPGFVPGENQIVAFSARTTAATQDVFLDNIKVSSTALPVINTGGPIISEFAASNSIVEDDDADKSGWIEIFNGSGEQVNLLGYYLTDDPANLKKWKAPGLTVNPYNYRVIYASGKDRVPTPTNLPTGLAHTNFRLANEGGYLALVRPDGQAVVSEYKYGPQSLNVSYGEKGKDRKKGYMYPPTPAQTNTSELGPDGVSESVVFSHPGGVVASAFDLTIEKPKAAGAVVRYTLDNTDPNTNSPEYSAPIRIDVRTTVRASVFTPGKLPSSVVGRTFLMVDASLTSYAETGKPFESNLPLVVVDSYGFNVDSATAAGKRPFRLSYAAVIPTDPKTGRAVITGPAEYLGRCGTHIRGESSAGFTQKSYALELWDDENRDKEASLLGMPEDSDWALYGPWSEKTLMRNKLVFEWMIKLRGYDGMAVRTKWVELFFNQSRTATALGYTGTYKGVYVLMEKLKRGKDRVPLENLNALTTDPGKVTGGYIFRKDKEDREKTAIPARIGPFQSFDPDTLNAPQLAYLRKYIADLETALNGAKFADPAAGYAAYMDTSTFIDAQWMLEIAKQVDGYVFSTYWHKNRAGKVRAGPLWDFNISLGNADYATGDKATGWLYDAANGAGQLWYPRLHTDPNYKIAHWDRYWHMRRSFLATDNAMATIDGHTKTLLDGYDQDVPNRAPANIQNPVARQYRKYPQLGVRDWPNPAATTKLKTYQSDVAYMKDWLSQRLAWLDDQTMLVSNVIYRPPSFSQAGGALSAPISLTITAYEGAAPTGKSYAAGAIMYTTDGSDPRERGGAVSATAKEYSGPLNITSSTTVRARLHNAGKWSALNEATYRVNIAPASAANLVISEIMYNPHAPVESESSIGILDSSVFEYLELSNIGQQDIDLNGVKLTEGVDFDFQAAPEALRVLAPGQQILIVADREAFLRRHPDVPASRIAGVFGGNLNNGGEQITINAADGKIIKQFSYDDNLPWPIEADTVGRSLELQGIVSNPDHGKSGSWAASATPDGSPGTAASGGQPNLAIDSDKDGLSDLFEQATGSNPKDPASMRLPRTSLVDGYLVFEYDKSAAGEAMKFVVESSEDLKTWSKDAGVVGAGEVVKGADGGSMIRHRGAKQVNGQGPKVFLRLSISQ